MNTRTFKVMTHLQMEDEINKAVDDGREPDTYIPVGNETRQVRRAKERAANKALLKQRKKVHG